MNVTWEMLGGFTAILVGMGSGFVWLARKFDRLTDQIGRLDKKKVSHKTCEERRDKCPCMIAFTNRIKKGQ